MNYKSQQSVYMREKEEFVWDTKISKEVRQGCSLASLISNILIEQVIKVTKGYKMKRHRWRNSHHIKVCI